MNFATESGLINRLSFNQDFGCFSASMDSGTRIYNTEPLQEKVNLDTATVGSVAVCEMLYRTNLLAIVGGGQKQKFAENAVLIWDDTAQKFVSEFTFTSPVLNLKVRRDRLFVALRHHIHVFGFPNSPTKLFTVDTGDNDKGLFEVSPYDSSERKVLVFPGHSVGYLQILDLARLNRGSSAAPIYIKAHRFSIAYIALNNQGTKVATASVEGTNIKVFDTQNQTQLIQLRRGKDHAVIYSMNFSNDSEYLCASSDKGTIHLFALKDKHFNKRVVGAEVIEKFMMPPSWATSPQWSFATLKVAEQQKNICAFGANSTIYVICVDGTFHKYVYTNEGSCLRKSFDVFLNLGEDFLFDV